MKDLLTRINKIQGVKGTMLVGADGLMIASDMSGGYDENTLAAVASSVSNTIAKSVDRLNAGKLSRFVINGTDGNVALLMVHDSILLTLVRKDANMGMVLVELKEAAKALEVSLG